MRLEKKNKKAGSKDSLLGLLGWGVTRADRILKNKSSSREEEEFSAEKPVQKLGQ